MAERIVSMHAAHRSGKEVVDGFLSRPSAGGERSAIVLAHGYRGLDDGQRAVTRRFAQEGFVCLSPDLFHARIGRAMTAIRQDEVATELIGVNVRAYKLFSFVLGAALAGLAGALNAHFTFFISPNEYGFERGVEILAMGVLGGTTSPWGALIGAGLVTLLPEFLRGLGHYRPLINGIILIVIILYSPKGIWDLLQFVARRMRPSIS